MRRPKTIPLRASNAIFAWMQRYQLPDNFLTDDVNWDMNKEGYVFGFQEKQYLCTKEGLIKEIIFIKDIEEE